MAFVRVTDRDAALEYYKAGLLWESRRERGVIKAFGWEETCLLRECAGENWAFYIYLED